MGKSAGVVGQTNFGFSYGIWKLAWVYSVAATPVNLVFESGLLYFVHNQIGNIL